MLDQERCILCTRCTRFVDTVTKTHELGIFRRGHTERIELTPGKVLDNDYSGNVVDICPVGALTDRDFRYKVRVWYLDKTDSICPGCSRGCSISVHTNTQRPWHNDGKRVARLKPRLNAEVNGYWMCDDGRYGFGSLDADRLGRVLRLSPKKTDISWETASAEISAGLRHGISRQGIDGLAVVASGLLSNEDWSALKVLFAGVKRLYFTPEPDQVGTEDQILRKKDKVPNLQGAQSLGLISKSFDELAKDIESGAVWGVYIVERDLVKIWGMSKAQALLAKCEFSVYQGPNKNATSELVTYRLPATAYVEEEGHFTNFEGKVQKYHKALEPIGMARPDWSNFVFGSSLRWS
jgi:NADH-quinone oxidoreductase subunit G